MLRAQNDKLTVLIAEAKKTESAMNNRLARLHVAATALRRAQKAMEAAIGIAVQKHARRNSGTFGSATRF
jgi:peptidoglycan hydrolase CwlO-like protein